MDSETRGRENTLRRTTIGQGPKRGRLPQIPGHAHLRLVLAASLISAALGLAACGSSSGGDGGGNGDTLLTVNGQAVSGTVPGDDPGYAAYYFAGVAGTEYTVTMTEVGGDASVTVVDENHREPFWDHFDAGNYVQSTCLENDSDHVVCFTATADGDYYAIVHGDGSPTFTIQVSSSGGGDDKYAIGGSVTGLTGTLVLQNNGGDDLTLSDNTTFAFDTELGDGESYAVTVLTQPDGQDCPVTDGTGTVAGADVTDVAVACGDTDTTNPTVTDTSPAMGDEGVELDAVITATFSESMDATTIATSTFTLSDASGSVAGSVSYDDATFTATFTPSADLSLLTEYTATISTEVTDLAGNAPSNTKTWSFDTRGNWSNPAGIESATESASNLDVGANASGSAIATWLQSDGTYDAIWANHYTPGSGWSGAEVIHSPVDRVGYLEFRNRVFVFADGSAIAVWNSDDDTQSKIWFAKYAPESGWGTALVINTETGDVDNLRATAEPSGNAIVTWEANGSFWALHYSGTDWGAKQTLASNAYYIDVVESAVDENGNAVAVCGISVSAVVWAYRYVAGSGWSTEEIIDDETGISYPHPKVAMLPSGDAIAVWNTHGMKAGKFTAGTGWGAAEAIGSSGQYFDIAMDKAGNAFSYWTNASDFEVVRYEPASGWGTVEVLNEGFGTVNWTTHLAFGQSGKAVAVWTQDNSLRASLHDPATGWGMKELIGGGSSMNPVTEARAVFTLAVPMAVWIQNGNIYAGRME